MVQGIAMQVGWEIKCPRMKNELGVVKKPLVEHCSALF